MSGNISTINRATLSSVCIKLLNLDRNTQNEYQAGTGSGFIYEYKSNKYLITNWHVVTARNPDNPGYLLEGYHESPSRIAFHLTQLGNRLHFPASESIDLYSEGKPIWIESSQLSGVDIVAIRLEFRKDAEIVPVNKIKSMITKPLSIQDEVVIIGFPFGQRADLTHAVWKRASIATEPSLMAYGKPTFLLDSPGRPGMSGSPVFKFAKGLSLSNEEAKSFSRAQSGENALSFVRNFDFSTKFEVNVLDFVGTYSGSIGSKDLKFLNLGMCWHAFVLEDLLERPASGQNPFPPPQS